MTILNEIEDKLSNKENLPKKLYHLTPLEYYDYIQKEGLKIDKSESSLQGIFLTDNINVAKNYAYMRPEYSDFIILVIDGTKLDVSKIGPDNYEFPDLISQMNDDESEKYNLDSWEDSLMVSNQIVYYDDISLDKIIKIIKYKS